MKTPLRYLLNPCDIDRAKGLGPIGDALAKFFTILTAGTECNCCLGARVLALTTAAVAAGYTIGALTQ